LLTHLISSVTRQRTKKISWSKQDALSRVVKAWESRQGKSAKKLGGYSLLAISLAACNSSDDTPFAQSDIDTAVTTALTAADGTVHASVDAAVTSGGGASAATTLTDANGTTHASVDAAVSSNDTSIANAATSAALTAADGTIYANVGAAYTAGNTLTTATAAANATTAALTGADGTVHATVDAAITSNDAAVQTAHETSLLTGTSFTSVADLITSYNALNAPAATSAALTTAADSLVGTAGANDTFTATNLTLTAGDVIVDSSSTDSDTLTVTVANSTVAAGTTTSTMSGIENVIFNFNSVATPTATVTAMGSGTVTINQASTAAAATVTSAGNVTVVGGTGVTGLLTVNQTAASALTVQAGNATTVTTTGGTTGSTTITGAATNIDTTVTTANVTTSAAAGTIDLNNVGAADVATVSAGATTTLTSTGIETLSLSGNGVASVITMDGNANGTATNLIGSQDLTVAYTQGGGAVSAISSGTVTNTNTGNSTIRVTLAAGAGETEVYTSIPTTVTLDLIGTANAGDSVSVSNGAVVTAGADTTADLAITLPAATAATNVLNLTANQDQTAGITVANAKTVNLVSAADTGTGADADGTMSLVALVTGTANVVVTGSSPLTLTAASTANKIDASALTGVLTVATTVANTATITGGTGNDVFTLVNDAAGTWNGGAGTDTLIGPAGVWGLQAATISNFEIINADSAASTVLDFLASQLNGSTMTIVADNGNATAIQVDDALAMDSQTLDLSGLVFDTSTGNMAAAAVVVDASQQSGSLSANANMTITGTAQADTITGNDGTGVNTISSGAGADIIVGGAGADIITTGAGADIITGGDGADVIALADGATAAVDIVILTNALTSDTITGFTVGAGGDDLTVDLSGPETISKSVTGVTLDIVMLDDAADSSAVANAAIQEVADQAGGAAVAAAANIDIYVLLTETYASTGAVETGLEIGDHELTLAAGVDQNDAFVVVYSDGTDAHVALVRCTANPGTDFTTSDLTVLDMATIAGTGTLTAG